MKSANDHIRITTWLASAISSGVPDLRHSPREHECDDEGQLEGAMRRHPEPSSRYTALLRLHEVGPLRPCRVDDEHLVDATAERHQGEHRDQADRYPRHT